MREAKTFTAFSLFILVYSILVILWGAWVRISGSGDGCGENWPLCHDQFIPQEAARSTLIEFIHRLSSGLYGILIVVLTIWAWRRFAKGHWVRKAVAATAILTVTEALLGAQLVLAGLVADNASVARAYTMMLHMVNSLLLTGSVALVYDWSRYQWPRFSGGSSLLKKMSVLLPLLLIPVAVTGAVAALSGTLFPSQTLFEGLRQDLASDSHFLVRLRVWHPLLATVLTGYVCYQLYFLLEKKVSNSLAQATVRRTIVVLVVGILFGYATLFSLSPVWMKLTHLALAHFIWISVILCFSRSLMMDSSARGPA